MYDVTGKELAVGDNVVFIPENGYIYELSTGFITDFTLHEVKIIPTNKARKYSADTCLMYPEQVAKV